MKNPISYIIPFLLLFFVACQSDTSTASSHGHAHDESGKHLHDEGGGHSHAEEVHQETFTLDTDTLSTSSDSSHHMHDDGTMHSAH